MQLNLIDAIEANKARLDMDRGGETFEPELDAERLNKQQRLVWDVVKGGKWTTLRTLSDMTGASEASVSARLRDFRKLGLTVDRERVDGGLFKYRVRAEA